MRRITAYLSSLLFSRRDDGYSTETVIITAALVALAAGLVVVIGDRVELESSQITGG